MSFHRLFESVGISQFSETEEKSTTGFRSGTRKAYLAKTRNSMMEVRIENCCADLSLPRPDGVCCSLHNYLVEKFDQSEF